MSKKVKTSDNITGILIAEDSPTQAAQIKYLLETHHYKTTVTQNGHEALTRIAEHKPSLVISDIVMPGMTGFELCETIKSDKGTEDIPVILLTSLANTEEIIKGLLCGADSFITKPFNNEYLIYNVEKILAEKTTPETKGESMGFEISYAGKNRLIRTDPQKVVKLLLNIYQETIHKNNELIQTRDELRILNENLETLVDDRTAELKKNEEKILAFNAELEQRVSERTTQADAANRAKSEFLANMSHEIRTPMNAILGYADLLSFTMEDKSQKDYIESIKSSGRSLLSLIDDILDLSKIEAGKLELQLEIVNSQSFFSEFERIFSLRLSEKGLKFIVEISSDIPEGIYIDDARLRQIILNLIGNAIKFTHKGSIRLKVYGEKPQIIRYTKERADEYIDLIIEITDTGIGISKEMQEDIFDPFVQGQGQNVKKYGGTGLGLAITKRLIQLMSGTIELDSQLNEGSSFKIKIPEISFLRNFSKQSDEILLNPSEIIFEEAIIIVADDIEHNRSYLKDALKNTSLKIFEAQDGQEALSLAIKLIPDLIITDIRMPVLDGFELLDRLKSNDLLKHIPVIAYSASVMKEQREHIRESEFAGLLIKPVLVTELYLEIMKNLPYRSKKVPDFEQSGNEIDPESEISDLPGLINSLDTRFKDIWKTFEIIQPIGEIRDFGNKLLVLGKSHNSLVINGYGESLISAADNFNIETILKLIRKFPGIIESINGSDKKSKK
jgi:signal transduction histidine kinase/CheY-like chemotaxis protein